MANTIDASCLPTPLGTIRSTHYVRHTSAPCVTSFTIGRIIFASCHFGRIRANFLVHVESSACGACQIEPCAIFLYAALVLLALTWHCHFVTDNAERGRCRRR